MEVSRPCCFNLVALYELLQRVAQLAQPLQDLCDLPFREGLLCCLCNVPNAGSRLLIKHAVVEQALSAGACLELRTVSLH
jgi:hypothetical protein